MTLSMTLRDPVLLGRRGWTPAALASDFWVKAASSNVVVDGSNGVQQFTDLSGNGRHALQATPAIRPIYGASGAAINGKDVLTFTRANATFLDLGDVMDLGTGSFSYGVVLRRRSPAQQGVIGKNIAGSTDGRYGLFMTNTEEYQGIYDQNTGATGVVVAPANAVGTVAAIIAVLERNGASSKQTIWVNGVPTVKTFSDVATSWDTTAPWRLGRYGISTAFDFEGEIAEVINGLRTWSADEVAALQAYFSTEWGTP